ncbi:hypothetical protein PGQ11_009411 [Apiospora arundinis]|uniref:Uncharacterized protein n=1 Tax=Apiospora arundinis TaxID=335852 RepID=A0ABR2IHX7_9PEZI
MRDQQARGKDSYGDPEKDKGPGSESFISQKQHDAARILNSPESLMNETLRTGDSVPAVRWEYQKILCGIPQEPVQSTSANSSKKSNRSHKKY